MTHDDLVWRTPPPGLARPHTAVAPSTSAILAACRRGRRTSHPATDPLGPGRAGGARSCRRVGSPDGRRIARARLSLPPVRAIALAARGADPSPTSTESVGLVALSASGGRGRRASHGRPPVSESHRDVASPAHVTVLDSRPPRRRSSIATPVLTSWDRSPIATEIPHRDAGPPPRGRSFPPTRLLQPTPESHRGRGLSQPHPGSRAGAPAPGVRRSGAARRCCGEVPSFATLPPGRARQPLPLPHPRSRVSPYHVIHTIHSAPSPLVENGAIRLGRRETPLHVVARVVRPPGCGVPIEASRPPSLHSSVWRSDPLSTVNRTRPGPSAGRGSTLPLPRGGRLFHSRSERGKVPQCFT